MYSPGAGGADRDGVSIIGGGRGALSGTEAGNGLKWPCKSNSKYLSRCTPKTIEDSF